MPGGATEKIVPEEQIRSLNNKSIYFKGQITSLNNYVGTYKDSIIERCKLREKINRLRNQFEIFNNNQDKLVMLTNESQTIEKLREEVSNNYDDAIAAAVALQESFSIDQNTKHVNHSPVANSTTVKLPKIDLPKFDGRLENWVTFKDAFQTMIHSRTALGNIEKLNYLKLSLTGKAAIAIGAFTISEDNYEAAWNHLIEIYDNKRALVLRHASLLRDTPAMPNDSSEAVRDLANYMQLHIRSLEALGRTWEDIANDLLASIIISRMDKDTEKNWERTLSDTEVPKIKDIFKFLHLTAHQCKNYETTPHITTPPSPKSQQSNHNNRDKRNIHQTRSYRGSSPSSSKSDRRQTFATATRTSKCKVCNVGEHAAFQCKKFLDLTVEKRIEAARKANLCLNCLKPGHSSYECRGGRCRKCNRPHNSRLHLDNKNAPEKTESNATDQSVENSS